MKKCSICREEKPKTSFYKDPRHSDGLFSECKGCKNTRHSNYRKTKEGLLGEMFFSQRSNTRGNGIPTYSKKEFVEFGLSDFNFNICYDAWVRSGYKKQLTPSTDRIDTLGIYEFNNIQFITFEDNYKKQAFERKMGIDNRVNKAVLQVDKNTQEIIGEFYSISEASRVLGLNRANLAKVCKNSATAEFKNKYHLCGGYRWIYKDKQGKQYNKKD